MLLYLFGLFLILPFSLAEDTDLEDDLEGGSEEDTNDTGDNNEETDSGSSGNDSDSSDEGGCADAAKYDKLCPYLKEKGYCSGYLQDHMKKWCKKTCGNC
ncbi:hypothetical protein RB195_004223 [Necator americanus]|uniref:ShKT domain-containing protein n=1 Tax=Necator americanus TaxID=51031 RepID=A0ABR1BKQ1_NECAM